MARGRGRSSRNRPPKTRRKQHGALLGTLHVMRPGSAEVRTPEGTFAVAKHGLRGAMDGDTVGVSLISGPHGRRLAVVQHVAERAHTTLLGIYEQLDPLGGLRPLDGRLQHDFFILPADKSARELGVSTGDLVQARILSYPARGEAGVVTLERRLGSADEVDLSIETVIASYGLPYAFSAAALNEAAALKHDAAATLEAQPWRRNLMALPLVTIDPPDARDYDDAVYATRTPEGFELTVAIADVSHYVAAGSSLDAEALARTCSAYLPDRVLPMLPERLSGDLCSLVPGEPRLAMAVTVQFNRRGEVQGAEAFAAAIKSQARLDYDGVEAFFEAPKRERAAALAEALAAHAGGSAVPTGFEAVALGQSLEALDELAGLRLEVRLKRGAIDFDSAESKIQVDADGKPVDVRVRTRNRATSLVEEAMLVANECVAAQLAARDIPTAYRVHEPPSPDDLLNVVPVLKELDLVSAHAADAIVAGDPYAIEAVLRRAQGTPSELLVSTLLVRAMKRAVYLPQNTGHYALGADAYCHFTSPIRRYPDLVVHRTLKALWSGELSRGMNYAQQQKLAAVCRQCSDGERRAAAAERKATDVKMAELYAERLGTDESGIVVGCVNSGLFVRLDLTGAEGFVPVKTLGTEWFDYDQNRLTLTGVESGIVWRLGKRVAVRVTDVDVPRGRIDLVLSSTVQS